MVGVYQHAREREKRGKRKKVELQTREWVPSGLVISYYCHRCCHPKLDCSLWFGSDSFPSFFVGR